MFLNTHVNTQKASVKFLLKIKEGMVVRAEEERREEEREQGREFLNTE